MCKRVFAAAVSVAFVGHPVDAQTPETVVEWIRADAIELQTAEPGHALDDLMPLKDMIGDARIVGLGESTHGTREIFQMKHRLFEFLVEEMGFAIFGIEASMPACMAINEYVLRGEGDAAAALHGQGFWTWDTEEVLALIKWMRAYNEDPAHERKLRFYGYDMQDGASALYHALRFLRPVAREQVAAIEQRIPLLTAGGYQSSYGLLTEQQRSDYEAALDDLAAVFDEHRQALVESSSIDTWAIMRRNAVIARQYVEMVRAMAEVTPGVGLNETQRLVTVFSAAAAKLRDFLDTTDFVFAEEVEPFLTNFIGLDAETVILRYREEFDDQQRDAWFSHAKRIENRLTNRAEMYTQRSDPQAYFAAVQHASDLVAFLDVCEDIQELPERPPNVRDRCMAENVAWILEHEGPDAKIAVWAHNGHVQHMPAPPGTGSMGNELERTFGDDYTVIGFSFNRGSFQAINQSADGMWDGKPALRPHTVGNAKHDSFDIACAETGMPLFMLDMRTAPAIDAPGALGEVGRWFARPHPLRMIGALFGTHLEQSMYAPIVLADHYDIMVFIYQTTAARPNPLTKQQFGIEQIE